MKSQLLAVAGRCLSDLGSAHSLSLTFSHLPQFLRHAKPRLSGGLCASFSSHWKMLRPIPTRLVLPHHSNLNSNVTCILTDGLHSGVTLCCITIFILFGACITIKSRLAPLFLHYLLSDPLPRSPGIVPVSCVPH